MNKATQVVNMLLEAQVMRVCAQCEKEFGPVPVAPGTSKSHGLCKRHAIKQYQDAGLSTAKVTAMPPENFAPDLAESVSSDEAQRFARDNGLALHPKGTYGVFSTLADATPEQAKALEKLAAWQFTAPNGITFYAPVNSTYAEMQKQWERKQKEFLRT